MKRGNNEKWKEFENRVSAKRNKTEKKGHEHVVPTDIMVQRMSAVPSGRLKKFEPLDTRDFVPFTEFTELSLENIKNACEKYYRAPDHSCDVLASDRGPSCTRVEQLKGKKVFFIRFIDVGECLKKKETVVYPESSPGTLSPSKVNRVSSGGNAAASKFAKSISIGDLLKAGRLIKQKEPVMLELEYFQIDGGQWEEYGLIEFVIEEEKFANGAFRNAFKAVAINHPLQNWVVKQYTPTSVETMKEHLGLTPEDHTRKQVQMHTVARNVAQRFSKKAPPEFGPTFSYSKVFIQCIKDFR